MRELVALISIPIILLLFYNQAANWHFHQLPSGIVIEHSHPVPISKKTSDSPYQKHTHSNWEMFLYAMVSAITSLLVIQAVLLLKVNSIAIKVSHFYTRIHIPLFTPVSNPHRGPPSIF